MRIYIASSWKNQHAVEMLTENLELSGHEVVSFVREAKSTEKVLALKDKDAWIESESGEQKFSFDLDGACRSDLVIYIGPSGTDAWAEVGAAWASRVPIVGLWAKGEQAGLMRRMVLKWYADYRELLGYVEGRQFRLNARQAARATNA